MNAKASHLNVFLNDQRVGALFDTDPLSFEYSSEWLDDRLGIPLGGISRRAGRMDDVAVLAFFDNLLPEGELRSYLQKKHQTSTVYGLVRALGGDCAGAFVILPAGKSPSRARYEATTWEDIAAALASGTGLATDIKTKDARISLAGAQDKTALAISTDGRPLLPHDAAPSTHILKPDIRRLKGVWSSALNEAIVMRAARGCELGVANVDFESRTRSCLVERFDRVGRPPHDITRLVQFDFCQLTATPSGVKYEQDGGPGMVRCAKLIRDRSSRPAVDLRRLVQWLFFNLYTGNNDSHAKNLAIYWTQAGASLTPFYDLMCTRLYPGLARGFAFSIGGETLPGKMRRKHFAQLASELGMKPAFILDIADSLTQYLPGAIDGAIAEMTPSFQPGDEVFAERLRRFIRDTTRKTAARILAAA